MGMRRPFFPVVLFLILLLLAGDAAAEGETAKFSLLQTFQEGDDLRVFSEVLDVRGRPVAGLGAEDLRATLGADPVPVRTFLPFSESGDGTAVLFLVDISKSLSRKDFAGIRDSLAGWIREMGEQDRVSVVAFGEDIQILAEFGSSRSEVLKAVSRLAPTDNLTQLNRAILKALDMGQRIDRDIPARRAVVLVSDGMDDTRGGATREEALRALENRGIPLWAVGFHSGKLTEARKAGLSSLGEMARISGGDAFLVDGKAGFPEAFSSLRERLQGVYAARLDCSGVSGSGEPLRLQAVLSQGGRVFTDGRDVRFLRALAMEPAAASPKSEEEVPGSEKPVEAEKVLPTIEGEPTPAGGTGDAPKKGFPTAAVAGAILLLGGGFFFLRGKSGRSGGREEEVPLQESLPEPRGPFVSETRGVPLKLEVVRGPHRGEVFDLKVDSPLSVGRAQKGNQLVLKGDLGVSGRHMEIFQQDGALFVRDLRSTNGIFVNGVKIQADRRIQNDDILLLGGTELRAVL